MFLCPYGVSRLNGIVLVILLLLWLPASSAGADDLNAAPDSDLTELSLEELATVRVDTVYSASRFEQEIANAPASVTIITAEEIKRFGYRSLADILRAVRSFSVSYDRIYDHVGIRGFNRPGDFQTRLLLQIDGNRINDTLYESAPMGTEFPLDIDLVERIEIIRGPSSSLYGTNAFFGVINVITRRASTFNGAELAASGGSLDTYQGRASYGMVTASDLEAVASGTWFRSGGQPRLFYPSAVDTNNGYFLNGDVDQSQSVYGSLRYKGFSLAGAYINRNKTVPNWKFTRFNDTRSPVTDEHGFVNLNYQRPLQSWLDLSAGFSYNWYRYQGDYPYPGVGLTPINRDTGTANWVNTNLQFTLLPITGNRLVVASEFRASLNQDQQNFDLNPYTVYLDDHQTSQVWALALEDEWQLTSWAIINGGVRYDHYSTFGGTTNPRIALIIKPFDTTNLKFLYGKAFQAPNSYELYYVTTGYLANPRLQPEHITTYEIALEQELGWNFRGSVSAFYNRITNLIDQLASGDPANLSIQYVNRGTVDAKGIELEVRGEWSTGLLVRAHGTLQCVRDMQTSQVLSNSPRQTAALSLSLPLVEKKVFLGFEEIFTGWRTTMAGSSVGGYAVTNLTLLTRNTLPGFELSATVYNLFNRRYDDPSSLDSREDTIPQDGIGFRVKAQYRF